MTSQNLGSRSSPTKEAETAARCHEMQVGLALTEVPEFEHLQRIGMAVRLALHIRGIQAVDYDTLKLVASHFLSIPVSGIKSVLHVLADIEFVKLQTEGQSIKKVVPVVPYYEGLYQGLGEYSLAMKFCEAEMSSIEILSRLSKSPESLDTLRSSLGLEDGLFNRVVNLGKDGNYLNIYRARGRDIAMSPTYFSENAEMFADLVSSGSAEQVRKVIDLLRSMQGVPLTTLKNQKNILGFQITEEDVRMLTRLAQEGAVKPPSITTSHAGENFFLFTPTPSGAALSCTKRDVYEKAMAIVASVRQGQFLPNKYRIHSPGALLCSLKDRMKLNKATTEASQQYQQLVYSRVAILRNVGNGYSQLEIIDTPENREALSIACDLVSDGVPVGAEVDEVATQAFTQGRSFVESLIASASLKKKEVTSLSDSQEQEIQQLFLKLST